MKTITLWSSFVFLCLQVASLAFATPQKVVLVILENTSYQEAIAQPFLSQLAKGGALLTNYTATAHPSEPNYVALVAGATLGVDSDDTYNLPNKNITDLLEAKGLTWHVYAENYPGNCFAGDSGLYARKHNPLISFTDISGTPARCANITNEANFLNDFKTGKLSTYNMYVPNLDDDGHDTSAATADAWMSKEFSSIISDPAAMQNTVIITTFDEDDGLFGSNGGQVYASFYGPDVVAGTQISTAYTHVSMLATIESWFQLGNLGQGDATASPIAGFLK